MHREASMAGSALLVVAVARGLGFSVLLGTSGTPEATYFFYKNYQKNLDGVGCWSYSSSPSLTISCLLKGYGQQFSGGQPL